MHVLIQVYEWCDWPRLVIPNLCDGPLSPCRRRASLASCAPWGDVTRRRWSGRRRSSEALHTLSLHCDPWPPRPQQRALRALTWETRWPRWKAIFLFPGYHICYDANRVRRVPPTTRCFQGFFVCLFSLFVCFFLRDFLTGRTDRTKHSDYLFLFFLPRHCDCISEKSYTLCPIYAILPLLNSHKGALCDTKERGCRR